MPPCVYDILSVHGFSVSASHNEFQAKRHIHNTPIFNFFPLKMRNTPYNIACSCLFSIFLGK